MISLLVSSKTMVPNVDPFGHTLSTPQFLTQANELNEVLKSSSIPELQKLMHISKNLAGTTQKMISDWSMSGGTPAWYTFVGDVYKGLKISEFTKDDIEYAQAHMGTISGLYGIVRPLDAIRPYRLELMYKLSAISPAGTRRGGFKDLYEFWGGKIAQTIPSDEPVINLSSEEYIKVLRPYLPTEQIITPWFMQLKNNKPVFQVIHAKFARGIMARWIAKNRINNPELLRNFNLTGYAYLENLSTSTKPVFVRAEGYNFRADY